MFHHLSAICNVWAWHKVMWVPLVTELHFFVNVSSAYSPRRAQQKARDLSSDWSGCPTPQQLVQ